MMRSKMFIVVKKNDVFKAVIVAIVTVFLVAMTAVGGVAPVYLAAEKRLVPVYSVETDEKGGRADFRRGVGRGQNPRDYRPSEKVRRGRHVFPCRVLD
ncbi:MAG: hypothetical protein L6V79_04380 [Clostridium sp.]|nr:MAG: hypothetical protein L6V79_04380 [Clostridium sp.]